MRKILIRFDDICPTMDFEQFNRAVTLMDNLNIKPLIGVIPNCKDKSLMLEKQHDDFWQYIKCLERKGYRVAMHGFEHIYDSKKHGIANSSNRSEFSGHSYEVQYKKISDGKKILEENGIYTNVFFAPSHSYDYTTLKALADCGFKYVSDGMAAVPIRRYGIVCYPCRTGGIPIVKKEGYFTAVFHAHEWKDSYKVGSYTEFETFLNTYRNDIVDFSEYINQPVYCNVFAKTEEKIYVLLNCRIRPVLSSIKQGLIRKKREITKC